MGLIKQTIYYSLVFFTISCVTINIYFPATAVGEAADKIVEEVWGEKGKPAKEGTEKKEGAPQSRIEDKFRFTLSLLGPEDAFAQEADINVTTPAIRALKQSIKERSEAIKPFMDRGNVGISNDGLLVLRSGEGLNLKEKANLNRLLSAENKDREALYAEIAKANNFSSDRIPDIKKIFARSWVENAREGWWVQNENGEWRRK